MNITLIRSTAPLLLSLACALVLIAAMPAFAATTWVDEVWTMVSFEKKAYPTSDFDPYFDQLKVMRDGVARQDQQIVELSGSEKILRELIFAGDSAKHVF